MSFIVLFSSSPFAKILDPTLCATFLLCYPATAIACASNWHAIAYMIPQSSVLFNAGGLQIRKEDWNAPKKHILSPTEAAGLSESCLNANKGSLLCLC